MGLRGGKRVDVEAKQEKRSHKRISADLLLCMNSVAWTLQVKTVSRGKKEDSGGQLLSMRSECGWTVWKLFVSDYTN